MLDRDWKRFYLAVFLAAFFSIVGTLALAGPANAAELRLCVYHDTDVTRERADDLVAAWNAKEGRKYELPARIVKFEEWKTHRIDPIYVLKAHPYVGECDRVVSLVGNDFGFVALGVVSLVGLPIPQAMGAALPTHFTVRARWGSANQVGFASPRQAFRHELRHTLGCGHGTIYRGDCAGAVRDLKAAQTGEFFPVIAPIGRRQAKKVGGHKFYADPDELNQLLYAELKMVYDEQRAARAKRDAYVNSRRAKR